IYILWLYQRIMTGPRREFMADLVPRELTVVVPLLALLIVLGVYPKPALDVIDPAIGQTVAGR
ncbi:NADH-quinone oxidoreductase subunit M, partial [Mycobacterium kansasii]